MRGELSALTAPLLTPDSGIGDVFHAVSRLEAFLEDHTPFRLASEIVTGESFTEGGWAVSPTQAALCAREYGRTHAFAMGLYSAVLHAGALTPGRPVRVLYAGCGPWALLALPSMATLGADRVRFTLLDIHAESVNSVQALVASLGMDPWVEAVITADASRWRIPPDSIPDVVVTETMNVALEREPQVAIVRNLLAQAPDALLVPRSIAVELSTGAVSLGEVFRLDRSRVAEWEGWEGGTIPGGWVRVPGEATSGQDPCLLTRIETWEGVSVEMGGSSLTAPRALNPNLEVAADAILDFRYRTGALPGLEVRALPDRVRLPQSWDPVRLQTDLQTLEASGWVDHFVKQNYEGRWSVIPLRAPLGTEESHPILQMVSHPGVTEYVDTSLLDRLPYLSQVLNEMGFPLGAARLMRLDPGSEILTHTDPDLAAEEGWARLHVPISTNPGVRFVLNGRPVIMGEGEFWYLRLSDPHSVTNGGDTPRVHLVVDAPVGEGLARLLEGPGWIDAAPRRWNAPQTASSQRR